MTLLILLGGGRVHFTGVPTDDRGLTDGAQVINRYGTTVGDRGLTDVVTVELVNAVAVAEDRGLTDGSQIINRSGITVGDRGLTDTVIVALNGGSTAHVVNVTGTVASRTRFSG